jgi:diguanylate cyclase (GGDEF)-like protein
MATGRILVVDDELFSREVLGEALSAAGHLVRTAASGEEALERLSAEPVDLLVTDIVMPGMDGLALLEAARRRDPQLEVLAVTGRDDVKLAVRAMKAGCADFLQKPVEAEELVAAAGRALSRVQLRREHRQLLGENLEFVRVQALFRQGLKILATLDLERLQDLALQVLARVTDAQGAALWLADDRGALTLRAYRGVVDRAALPARLDPREPPWAGPLLAGAPFPAAGAPPGEAFHVPLLVDDEPLGLALLTHRARGRFGPEEQAAALTVADFAAIAARNARRFQAMERVGLRDRESGAYNLAYFVDYAGKEFYKARRYGRAFALVVLSVDNAEQLRKAAGRELFRRATRELVLAVSRVVRDADILAKVSDGEYYVLLPETEAFGALMFQRRAAEEIRGAPAVRQLEEKAPLLLSMGAGAFPRDGEDFDELLHWARARLEAARSSLTRRLHLEALPRAAFWETVDLLLDEGTALPEAALAARLPADPGFLEAVQREAAREIARDPRARGVLYVGTSGGLARAPVLDGLPDGEGAARAGDASVHVYLLGPRAGGGHRVEHPLVTEVYLDGDQRLATHQFVLFLSEQGAYAHLADAEGRAFHTADLALVDALVARLQALYDLQPL